MDIDFSNIQIEFSNHKYSTGETLRVGDVIRLHEPDEMSLYGLYAIYTWIPEINMYLWLSEIELFDYSTTNFDKDIDAWYNIFSENACDSASCCSYDDYMLNYKYLGNISDEKIRSKLDKDLINSYIHLYHF